jgi:hypothetical protein
MSCTVAESQHCCMIVFEYAVVEEEELDGDVLLLLVEGTAHQLAVMSMEGRVVGTVVGLQRAVDMVVFCFCFC